MVRYSTAIRFRCARSAAKRKGFAGCIEQKAVSEDFRAAATRPPWSERRPKAFGPRDPTHTAAHMGGQWCRHGRASSSWAANRKSVASSPKRADSCTPIGRPSFQ